MRITQPVIEDQPIPYNVVKILGCSDTTVGFEILDSKPTVSKRRYCNKVLVHECVSVPEIEPIELIKAEFIATADPCYSTFNIFKTSEDDSEIPGTVELQLDNYDLTVGILVHFLKEETCCLPLRMSYRLYGTLPDENRILLSQGNFLTSPCGCLAEDEEIVFVPATGCNEASWTGLNW